MGRAPCCDKRGLKKGPWSPEEDRILLSYIEKNGHENWRALPELAGLLRCGKSCRLRWTNYLRPDIKRGSFTREEEWTIIQLQAIVGNRWSLIASQLPQRTDNEIKNFWNTKLKKRLFMMGLDPSTHAPKQEAKPTAPYGYETLAVTRHRTQLEKERREAEARILGESLVMASDSAAGYHTNNSTVETFTNPNGNPPADYFLKIWNSENGKAFRNKNHHLNGRVDSILSYEIPPSSVSSLCCVSTQRSCDQAFNQKYEDKDNGSQRFNSASFEWIRDFNVKFPEELSCVADMDPCQTEDKAAEELGPEQTVHYAGFPKLLLGFPDHDDNNNNTSNIQSELSAGFQQQSASPWPEFHDEEYWSNMSFTACASANS